jgi:cell division protein ZapA
VGHVAITLNGRTYRLSCEPGEEARLTRLAAEVKTRFENLIQEFGKAGDERLLLMTALTLADELFEARDGATQPGAEQPSAEKRPPRKVSAA